MKQAATGCQWIGQEQDYAPYTLSCPCSPVQGRSYCPEHLARVYQLGTALRKRRKDIRRANAVWDIESDLNSVLEELESEGFL